MKRSLLILALVLAVVWLRTAFFSVDVTEFVYVTRFGHIEAIHDGGSNAGLHVKAPWPIDAVARIDRRVQSFDLPAVEAMTRDASRKPDKTIAVDTFVTWKIPNAEAADRFLKTVRTPEQAMKILGPLINGRLAALISTLPTTDLLDVIDTQHALPAITGNIVAGFPEAEFHAIDSHIIDSRNERIRRRLLGLDNLDGNSTSPSEDIQAKALSEYGIEIIDIRVRRFSYPPAVRSTIAERIRSERAQKAAEYETEGRIRASEIITNADRAARTIEANAKAEKTTIESKANADAAVIRSTAYEQDREFFLFLESLRSFRKTLANSRDLILLSTKHPLLRAIFDGPPGGMKKEK